MASSELHYPVMAAEVLEYLAPRPDGVYIDATAGLGGHTAAIASRLTEGRVYACDRDPESLELARVGGPDPLGGNEVLGLAALAGAGRPGARGRFGSRPWSVALSIDGPPKGVLLYSVGAAGHANVPRPDHNGRGHCELRRGARIVRFDLAFRPGKGGE